MTGPPYYPIIVGITGHRDIAPGAEPALRGAVRDILRGLADEVGDALYVMSALADGADQLVATEAEPLNLIAVSPMPLDLYRATVSNRDGFDSLWHRAALRLELPILSDPAAPDFAELQYEQLGALLARRSHLLLALWDGMPEQRRGGTAAVVSMRRDGDHASAGVRASPLFIDASWRLDLGPGGSIVQIVTPRASTGGAKAVPGQPKVETGDCFFQPGARDGPDSGPVPVHSAEFFAALPRSIRDDFVQIIALNRRIAGFRGPDRRVFVRQLGYLRPSDVADPGGQADEHLDRLRQWQAAADTAAQFYQRRLLGQFVPAWSIRALLANGWEAARSLRRPPRFGVLFGFAAAVPVAVLLFESYAHLGRSPWMLLCYLAVFAGTATLYHFHVRHHELQNRFQDYRALAEAMRVQLFWAAAATPAAVSDRYLRKQSGELGWIEFALRGPALWATALAVALKNPLRELVLKGWVEDQLRFFGRPGAKDGRAKLHEHAAARGRRWARRFLYCGLAVSALLAASEALRAVGVAGPQSDGAWKAVDEAQQWLLVLAATAPAIATFFIVSVNLRAYEAHAHSYALMGRLFSRAQQLANEADDPEFQGVARELGREALSETAEWLLDHRHRPIEHQ